MGEDCGSWLPLQQHFDWQSSNLNSLRVPLNLGQQNSITAYMNPCTNMVTANGTLPACAFPELPQSRAGQANELHGWFYCLPRFRHNFAPPANSIFKEKLCVGAHEDSREVVMPNAGSGSGCAQKKFLVFDQSGDQTTLIFSSGIGAPVQCLTSWGQKPPVDYNLNADDLGTKMDPIHHPSQIVTDEFNGTRETDVGSEMHEDTEELNALLYSDDGSDYTDDDDEVTSTGHSPSIMTAHIKQDWFEGITEEVVSSDGPTTRQKLVDGVYELPSLVDTSNSVKRKRSSEYEDDAQSSSGNGQNPGPVENDFLYGNKRMRKERIRETVSILQSIIPSGKGKDAIVVLDEAIHYLKSLKLKAKVLGLN